MTMQREAAKLDASIVHLGTVTPFPEAVGTIRKRLNSPRHTTLNELHRQALVAGMVTGSRLLDVGCALGVFLTLASQINKLARTAGVDIREYPSPLHEDGYERFEADVRALPFADGEFDTVVAMEIIEHLTGDVDVAVSELRRVAASRLLVTVPFCEPVPLYRGHHQRFDADRLNDLFPDATFTVMVKEGGGTPWVLADEQQ